MQQKHDHCSFCATKTIVYQLADGSWACKTVTNPNLPNFTCYSLWERLLKEPIHVSIRDF